jgi:hypothetical protein
LAKKLTTEVLTFVGLEKVQPIKKPFTSQVDDFSTKPVDHTTLALFLVISWSTFKLEVSGAMGFVQSERHF